METFDEAIVTGKAATLQTFDEAEVTEKAARAMGEGTSAHRDPDAWHSPLCTQVQSECHSGTFTAIRAPAATIYDALGHASLSTTGERRQS
jgi:hypothetical protein